MDPATIQAILGLINGGAGLFTSLFNRNSSAQQQSWIQNALISVMERARQGDDWARTMLQQSLDPASQAALSGINLAGNQVWQGDRLASDNQQFSNSLPELFAANQQAESPATAAARARLEGLADTGAARGDASWERFMNGGLTPQYQSLYDTLAPFLSGQGSNSQLEQQNVASDLLSHRGQTAYTQGFQDRAMDSLNQGGMNPYLQAALTEAAKILQNGGLTPENQAATQKALDLIGNEGENAVTQVSQSEGLKKALQDTVLPLSFLRNVAGEGATSQLQNTLKGLYANAARRGGGPGVTLGNGLNSAEFTDFLDFAPKVRADAEMSAAKTWQDAAQRDAALGVSLTGQGSQTALQRLAQGADLSTAGQNLANNRLNTAFSAIPGTQNSATNIMQTLGNLGLGALGSENQRMQIGSGLANDYNTGLERFLASYNNILTGMNGNALSSGQLSNSFTNTSGGLNQNLFTNDLSAMQTGLNRFGALSGAQNSALGNRNNLFNIFSGNYNSGIGQMTNIGGQYNDYARAMAPLQNPFGAWSRNTQNFNPSSAISTLTGVFGGKKED